LTPPGETTWNKLMEYCFLTRGGADGNTGSSGGCWAEAQDNADGGAYTESVQSDWALKLQQDLNKLAGAYGSIPRTAENGIFDAGTAVSLMEFQRIFGLRETGEADAMTLAAIARECCVLDFGRSGGAPQHDTRNMAMFMLMKRMMGM